MANNTYRHNGLQPTHVHNFLRFNLIQFSFGGTETHKQCPFRISFLLVKWILVLRRTRRRSEYTVQHTFFFHVDGVRCGRVCVCEWRRLSNALEVCCLENGYSYSVGPWHWCRTVVLPLSSQFFFHFFARKMCEFDLDCSRTGWKNVENAWPPAPGTRNTHTQCVCTNVYWYVIYNQDMLSCFRIWITMRSNLQIYLFISHRKTISLSHFGCFSVVSWVSMGTQHVTRAHINNIRTIHLRKFSIKFVSRGQGAGVTEEENRRAYCGESYHSFRQHENPMDRRQTMVVDGVIASHQSYSSCAHTHTIHGHK